MSLKISSIVSAVVIAGILIGGYSAWTLDANSSSGDDVSENELATSITENGINLFMSVENKVFSSGDNVLVTLGITNEREENLNLSFSSLPVFDIIIYDENLIEIGRWSDGRAFPMMVVDLNLAPGEVYSENFIWNQRISDSETRDYQQVPPGTYYLEGQLMTEELNTGTLSIEVLS